jgi:ribosomal protein S12 methylthiotransferase accessory factor
VAELRERYSQKPTRSACVAALAGAGIRVAAIDVTSPDVALTPLRVARVFGEYLQPIHFGAGNHRTNNPRLHRWLSGQPAQEPHPVA